MGPDARPEVCLPGWEAGSRALCAGAHILLVPQTLPQGWWQRSLALHLISPCWQQPSLHWWPVGFGSCSWPAHLICSPGTSRHPPTPSLHPGPSPRLGPRQTPDSATVRPGPAGAQVACLTYLRAVREGTPVAPTSARVCMPVFTTPTLWTDSQLP